MVRCLLSDDVGWIQHARRYFSPYPLTEVETDDIPVLNVGTMSPSTSASKIHGIARTSARSHGRTSDLLAGGLQRSHMSSEKAILWVCDKCFKYMADGSSWELHAVRHSLSIGVDRCRTCL